MIFIRKLQRAAVFLLCFILGELGRSSIQEAFESGMSGKSGVISGSPGRIWFPAGTNLIYGPSGREIRPFDGFAIKLNHGDFIHACVHSHTYSAPHQRCHLPDTPDSPDTPEFPDSKASSHNSHPFLHNDFTYNLK